MNILVRIQKKDNKYGGSEEGESLTKAFKRNDSLSFIYYVCSIIVCYIYISIYISR